MIESYPPIPPMIVKTYRPIGLRSWLLHPIRTFRTWRMVRDRAALNARFADIKFLPVAFFIRMPDDDFDA